TAGNDWRKSPLSARRELLENVALRLEAEDGRLSRQMALEIGKPITHAREEIHRAAANLRDVVRRAASDVFAPGTEPVRRRPLGVVGMISAWNNPAAIPLGKIGPALAFGNAAVWKPAPAAARIADAILAMLQEAGMPRDMVRILHGDHTTAQALAAQDGGDAITFTGSWAAGYAMQEICARRMISLQAELSGNNAAIVWDDADFAHAAAQVSWGAFAFAGQRCT